MDYDPLYGFDVNTNGAIISTGTLGFNQINSTTILPGTIATNTFNAAKRELKYSTLEDIRNMLDEAYAVWQDSDEDSDEAYGRYTAIKEILEILEKIP